MTGGRARAAVTIRDKVMYNVAKRAVMERKPDLVLLDGPLISNADYVPNLETAFSIPHFATFIHSVRFIFLFESR